MQASALLSSSMGFRSITAPRTCQKTCTPRGGLGWAGAPRPPPVTR